MSRTSNNVSADILGQMQRSSDPVEKQKLQDQLWQRASADGTPLLEKQSDGNYKITFLYKSSGNDEIELSCPDLHDRLLGENGKPRKFEKIPGTDTFILQLDNIPADTFAAYSIKKVGEKEPLHDEFSKKFPLYEYDIVANETKEKQSSYIQLPEAKKPDWANMQPPAPAEITRSIEHKEYEDPTKTFVNRDVFIYKPNNWIDIPPADRKVIFMLDGAEFCKTLTPYIDAMRKDENSPFFNTAIVFVDSKMTIKPYEYSSFNHKPYKISQDAVLSLPDRVYEYYFKKDDFVKMLAAELIPEYKKELGIENSDNVILAAHSLAAYPALGTALKSTEKIGGIILMSPALNLKMEVGLPAKPVDRLAEIPIYIQIGQLEDAKPPKVNQEEEDLKDEPRLASVQQFHQFLAQNNYQVEEELVPFSSGHSGIHAIDGLNNGLRFIIERQEKTYEEEVANTAASRNAATPPPENATEAASNTHSTTALLTSRVASGILGTQKTEPGLDQEPDNLSRIQTPGSKI